MRQETEAVGDEWSDEKYVWAVKAERGRICMCGKSGAMYSIRA